jgi:hypothetical protein
MATAEAVAVTVFRILGTVCVVHTNKLTSV